MIISVDNLACNFRECEGKHFLWQNKQTKHNFKFANFIYFIIHFFLRVLWHIENLHFFFFFCLLIISPTYRMDCNKQLHIKVNGPPVELCTVNLFIVVHTGFKQEQKQHLFLALGESHHFSVSATLFQQPTRRPVQIQPHKSWQLYTVSCTTLNDLSTMIGQ